jgi:hypothetical protein
MLKLEKTCQLIKLFERYFFKKIKIISIIYEIKWINFIYLFIEIDLKNWF